MTHRDKRLGRCSYALSLFAGLAGTLVLVSASASAQTIWHVDANGTFPGTGTQEDPYTSIQYAIDHPSTVGGDILWIRPGTYLECVDLTKPLTLWGTSGPSETVVQAPTPGPVLRLAAFSLVTVDGLTITGGTGPFGDGIEVVSGTTSIIQRCIVRDNERHGVFSNYDAHVDRCTVVRNGGSSLFVTPFPNSLGATQNILVNNGQGPDFGSQLGTVAWNMIDVGPFGDVPGRPRFWNGPANDFHLRPGSAAIDAGSAAPPHQDPDGSPADLGALVFNPYYHPDGGIDGKAGSDPPGSVLIRLGG